MPQNEYIDEHRKKFGRQLDHEERKRKREARLVHKRSDFAQKVHGLRAKLYHKKRNAEKIEMKKKINMHNERKNKHEDDSKIPEGAKPAYLLDRNGVSSAKVLSNSIKQKKRKRKLENGMFLFQKLGVFLKMKCSRPFEVENEKEKNGKGWLQKSLLLVKVSQESLPNTKDSFVQLGSVLRRLM